jgi:hypothetical protein
MWAGRKVLEALVCLEVRVALEGKVVPAVLVADNDSAVQVVVAEGRYSVAAVEARAAALVAVVHLAAEVADVFFASK